MGWSELLDAFEEHLVEHRRAVEEGRAGPAPVLPPARDPGPLPEELRPRAERLLADCRVLEGSVAGAREALAASIVRRITAGSDRTTRRAAVYIDKSV